MSNSFVTLWTVACQAPSLVRFPQPAGAILRGVPNLFDTREQFYGKQFFHGLGRRGGLGMIQTHYIY